MIEPLSDLPAPADRAPFLGSRHEGRVSAPAPAAARNGDCLAGAVSDRGLRSALFAAVVTVATLALAACSSGSSSSGKTTVPATTSPAPTTGTTAPAATTTPATTFAPGQTATSATGGASTTAAGRAVTSPSNNVHQGDTGAGVKQIQLALVAHGYKVGTDGQFGPQTKQAVVDFQKKNGLSPDGVVGPATWAKLQASSSSTTAAKATPTTVKRTTTTASH